MSCANASVEKIRKNVVLGLHGVSEAISDKLDDGSYVIYFHRNSGWGHLHKEIEKYLKQVPLGATLRVVWQPDGCPLGEFALGKPNKTAATYTYDPESGELTFFWDRRFSRERFRLPALKLA